MGAGAHTRFCLGPCLQWPRNVHTTSDSSLRASPAVWPVPTFQRVEDRPTLPSRRRLPAGTTADMTLGKQVFHLPIHLSQSDHFPCSTNSKICVLGFGHFRHQAPCASWGSSGPVAPASAFITCSAGHVELAEFAV